MSLTTSFVKVNIDHAVTLCENTIAYVQAERDSILLELFRKHHAPRVTSWFDRLARRIDTPKAKSLMDMLPTKENLAEFKTWHENHSGMFEDGYNSKWSGHMNRARDILRACKDTAVTEILLSTEDHSWIQLKIEDKN